MAKDAPPAVRIGLFLRWAAGSDRPRPARHGFQCPGPGIAAAIAGSIPRGQAHGPRAWATAEVAVSIVGVVRGGDL
jgi:hypothetical protein